MRQAHHDITSASTVNDVVAHVPIAFSVFNAFGIDTCCGGGASLGEAAIQAHVGLVALLMALDVATHEANKTGLGDDT